MDKKRARSLSQRRRKSRKARQCRWALLKPTAEVVRLVLEVIKLLKDLLGW